MNIAFTADVERLLRKKVADGLFPNEEAVIAEALKRFLYEDPYDDGDLVNSTTEILIEREPSPFIQDTATLPPADFPREGLDVSCAYLENSVRQPTLFPGE